VNRPQRRLLLHNAAVYTPEDPFATAMLISDGEVAWIGGEGAYEAFGSEVDEVVDLQGALVTPAFVDAHVHVTATGLEHIGLDLRHTHSRDEVLHAVRQYTEINRGHGLVLGQGWDETGWSDARAPSRAELDRAAYGGAVMLQRIDVHSCVVSSALRAGFPEIAAMDGYDEDGPLTGEAHHYLRTRVLDDLPESVREHAQRTALSIAAAMGVASVHEMAGENVSSVADVQTLQRIAADPTLPEVLIYWSDPEGVQSAKQLGCHGAGGDLFIDGTIGSSTALLREPYLDGGTGVALSTAAQVRDQVLAATAAGVQTGFHVIGDGAFDLVVAGMREAAIRVGLAAVAAGRHRLEHAELLPRDLTADLADLGVIASVQPQFAALWSGPGEMYDQRIGQRWQLMDPVATLVNAGIPVALGSDAPVTSLSPWETVRAAAFHPVESERISVRAAFGAHTRGGWRAARREGGSLRVGAVANFAVWESTELVVQAPDERVAAWSTDPRSGTPGLPDLTPGTPLPRCLWTVRAGHTLFGPEWP
jgi:predicted amidohydrolase YtcJ